MRQSVPTKSQLLWICLVVLSIPWTGPAINPHILEHEAEHNRAREALPPHVHEGVHFEAVWDGHASPDCFACLRSQAKGMVCAVTLDDGRPDAPHIAARPVHEHIASFRLAGRVAARAPPSFRLKSI